MKLLVTGAGGQLGHDVVAHARRAGDEVDRARPFRRSTSPTVMRSSTPSARSAPMRSSTPRRTPRSTPARRTSPSAYAVNADAVGHLADGARRGRRPPRPRQHRLRVRRRARPAVSRGRRDEPAVGLRAVEAGRRARWPAPTRRSCAPRGCAASTATTWSSSCSASPDPAPIWRSSTTSAAARRSPPTSRRRCGRSRSNVAPACTT